MITIGERQVGAGFPAYLIAEVAQAHDGSLGMAHAYIDAAAGSGADAVKFQTHIAAAESTRDDLFRVPFSSQDASRYDYWRRMEFTPPQWAELAAHCRDRNVEFLSSAFSFEAVHLLRAAGMAAWKVGSGEFNSTELLTAMCEDKLPILLSSGMSHLEEIDAGVALVKNLGCPVAVLQCSSRYPTPMQHVGLNVLSELARRYGCPVGLSDHSGTVFPSLAAMARGASFIEVHVVFDRRQFGPDTGASVTFEELRLLADARDAFSEMDRAPVCKNVDAGELDTMRRLFTKSVAPARPLPEGTRLAEDMLAPRKPGSGIPYSDRGRLIGRILARNVEPDRLLREEDLL